MTKDSEIGSRANDHLALASPLDFHKQVEAILEEMGEAYLPYHEFGERPENAETIAKAANQVTALIQTLVPEERVLPPINSEWTESWMWRDGGATDFNACRDIILSTIKGAKADE